MSADTPTGYTEDDVDQLAAMVRVRIGWPISAGEAATIVAVVLHELAGAGRLLPEDTRTEYGVINADRPGAYSALRRLSKVALYAVADDPKLTVVQRRVGPWVPAPAPCPTCSPPFRETVGMVCQTCGTDYAPTPSSGDEGVTQPFEGGFGEGDTPPDTPNDSGAFLRQAAERNRAALDRLAGVPAQPRGAS